MYMQLLWGSFVLSGFKRQTTDHCLILIEADHFWKTVKEKETFNVSAYLLKLFLRIVEKLLYELKKESKDIRGRK